MQGVTEVGPINEIKGLDLFSGIGGIALGLHRAGPFKTECFVENDPFCQRVLRHHWPDARIHDDVCTLDTSTLGDIDLIAGGFPCQDISEAGAMWGKREGLEGDRSGLWREFHRIISELRPRFVIVENVTALLHRGLGEVLSDLAQIGYDAEWHCIPASYLGASHIRDRVFIIAYAHGTGLERGQIVSFPARDGERSYKQLARLLESERELAIPTRSGGGIHDGVSRRLDKLRGLGNSVYVPVFTAIGQAILEGWQR